MEKCTRCFQQLFAQVTFVDNIFSAEVFMDVGLPIWCELVAAACFNGAIIVLSKLLFSFPTRVHLFLTNERRVEGRRSKKTEP